MVTIDNAALEKMTPKERIENLAEYLQNCINKEQDLVDKHLTDPQVPIEAQVRKDLNAVSSDIKNATELLKKEINLYCESNNILPGKFPIANFRKLDALEGKDQGKLFSQDNNKIDVKLKIKSYDLSKFTFNPAVPPSSIFQEVVTPPPAAPAPATLAAAASPDVAVASPQTVQPVVPVSLSKPAAGAPPSQPLPAQGQSEPPAAAPALPLQPSQSGAPVSPGGDPTGVPPPVPMTPQRKTQLDEMAKFINNDFHSSCLTTSKGKKK